MTPLKGSARNQELADQTPAHLLCKSAVLQVQLCLMTDIQNLLKDVLQAINMRSLSYFYPKAQQHTGTVLTEPQWQFSPEALTLAFQADVNTQ